MRLKKSQIGINYRKGFEWTVFTLSPVDKIFVSFFKKNISNFSQETLDKTTFQLKNQTLWDGTSFDNEKEAFEYAKKESMDDSQSLYIVKCRYIHFSINEWRVDPYRFIGCSYGGSLRKVLPEVYKGNNTKQEESLKKSTKVPQKTSDSKMTSKELADQAMQGAFLEALKRGVSSQAKKQRKESEIVSRGMGEGYPHPLDNPSTIAIIESRNPYRLLRQR